MTDKLHPWDQQEGEPNRWFQRFCAYRLQGPERSIEAVFVAKNGKGKRPGWQWYQIARDWRWKERADAWDTLNTEQAEAAIEAAWQKRIMGKSEVLALLSDIARGDMGEMMDTDLTPDLIETDEDGKVRLTSKTKLIKKIHHKKTIIKPRNQSGEEREIVEIEFELYSAHDAQRDIARHHGLFLDRTDVTSAGESIKADNGGIDRSLSKLADAIREILPGSAAKEAGTLDPTEQTSMAGPPIEGG